MNELNNTLHTIHEHQSHLGWDNALAPVLTIEPDERVEFYSIDASGGQLSAKSTVADLAQLDFTKVNPVVGPVYIDGAEPGDALKVTLLSFAPSGWGWTANIPGFGLLTDQFPEPALHIWKYGRDLLSPAMFGLGGRVPLKPFCGTIGVAPVEAGVHSVLPPRRVGGNMDIHDIGAGTVLYLPIEVKGALFSVGDTHAAQGDGEVCGTAIESPASLAGRFEIIKGAHLEFPRFTTPGPVSRHLDAKGYEVTTGIGPDLMEKRASRCQRNDRPAVEAAPPQCRRCLSTLQRLRRSAYQPDRRPANWVVSLYFPRIVFG
ncbi:acetamidase/formamidase family protein [Paraburkholderia sp. BL10I2N1]|uniref:acetamidase/formamidase family protein n=1 Tax=Paraburkholderia sp. BL10I2N1 TaxID=1938796 RepID=UPI0010EFD684|nr:acetamidase/formamidase family protein [Paraburkholderia sp. BL10I2N1]TDN69904.1 acetamidase/formamidase [Paraburkholderia sp. BL10I2N1]